MSQQPSSKPPVTSVSSPVGKPPSTILTLSCPDTTGIDFGGARSFGSPGTGGALGFADPDVEIGYGYVTSQMGMTFTGDPRDVALREALYSALHIS